MTTRKEFLIHAAKIGTLSIAALAGFSLAGCGGSSMASSAFEITQSGVVAYGNPVVEIQPVEGAGTTGGFEIESASSTLRVGEPILVIGTFYTEIPNVNGEVFPDDPPPIGTFSTTWSQADDAQTVIFNSTTGITFTGYQPSPAPNVRVSCESGAFFRASVPGPVTLRVRVQFRASDGSSKTKTFEIPLTIVS